MELTQAAPQKAALHPSPITAWSVNDQLAHLRACHDVPRRHMLRIIRQDHPAWKGMSPRTWQKNRLRPFRVEVPGGVRSISLAAGRAPRGHRGATDRGLGAYGDGVRPAEPGLRVQRALLRRLDGAPRTVPPRAHGPHLDGSELRVFVPTTTATLTGRERGMKCLAGSREPPARSIPRGGTCG